MSIARQPERDRQEQRHREEQARPAAGTGRRRTIRPPRSSWLSSMAGSTSARLTAAEPSPLPARKPAARQPPPRTSQITGDRPSHRGVGLGLDEPPGARAEDAEHHQAEAERRQQCADEVESRVLLGRGVGHPPGQRRMISTIEHLTDEDPAPGCVGGEQAADQRAGGHRDGARRQRPGHRRAAGRPRPKFVATSATIAGMISAAPMPSSRDQPNISTVRFGRARWSASHTP